MVCGSGAELSSQSPPATRSGSKIVYKRKLQPKIIRTLNQAARPVDNIHLSLTLVLTFTALKRHTPHNIADSIVQQVRECILSFAESRSTGGFLYNTGLV